MIKQQLRKVGNSYVITIPKDEVESHGWQEGDRFAVELTPLEERPVIDPKLRAIFEEIWAEHEDGLRYLADR
jgi:antitoxin component of MazEF toxin-antitoxin module